MTGLFVACSILFEADDPPNTRPNKKPGHLPCGGSPEGVLFFLFIGRVLIRFSDQTLQKELRGSLAPDEAEDAGGLDARQGRQRRLAQS